MSYMISVYMCMCACMNMVWGRFGEGHKCSQLKQNRITLVSSVHNSSLLISPIFKISHFHIFLACYHFLILKWQRSETSKIWVVRSRMFLLSNFWESQRYGLHVRQSISYIWHVSSVCFLCWLLVAGHRSFWDAIMRLLSMVLLTNHKAPAHTPRTFHCAWNFSLLLPQMIQVKTSKPQALFSSFCIPD
jgi:hypothetical protein